MLELYRRALDRTELGGNALSVLTSGPDHLS